jgi:hypothetical protein
MKYPTPESLRERANESLDDVPADIRDGVRDLYRAAADALERHGFYVSPTGALFLVTEAKALEVELRGITQAAENEVPGWRKYFEGKVFPNGTDLCPVTAIEATENVYATHRAAVLDSAHAMRKAGLDVRKPTKAMKRQRMYILPSYIGIATDRQGKVIEPEVRS